MTLEGLSVGEGVPLHLVTLLRLLLQRLRQPAVCLTGLVLCNTREMGNEMMGKLTLMLQRFSQLPLAAL